MENIIRLESSEGFTRHSEVLGVYYTSLPLDLTSGTVPMARITMKDSNDVFEAPHAVAKAIELVAFPLADRKPPVVETSEEA